MNIFHKVALQSLKISRTRTLVTIIGVVLSASLITAVTTFGVSLLHYMVDGAAEKYGGWHVAFLDADSAFAQEQAGSEEVAATATFENVGYAKLEGTKTPQKPYLFIAGFSQKTFDALPVVLFSGRLPENSGEILISGSVMTKGGVSYQVGDTLTVAVGQRQATANAAQILGQSDPYSAEGETFVPQQEKTYTVVGICQTLRFEEDSAPGYTVITAADAADAADNLSVFVTLKNPREVHRYAGAAASHACIFNNAVLRFMGLSDDPGDRIFNTLLYAVATIVVVIIMIGSVFLIYNSFNISLTERTHQFGILSSVGATAKQLRHSVLFEGLCIGAIGIPIGVLAGVASIGVVIGIVAKNFRDILYTNVPLTLTVSAPAIAAAAVVSMVTILISADLPARKAANMPVMECIRQTNEIKVEAKAIKTSPWAQRLYGVEGMLALKNFKRNKKRYRSIVLSLVLSIVLFISASAFVKDMEQASAGTEEVGTYDIGFATQDMDEDEMLRLYDKLKAADGVYESSYQAVAAYSCAVKGSDLSDAYRQAVGAPATDETVNLPLTVQFLDDGTYQKIVESLGLPIGEYTGQNAKLIAVAKMQDTENQAKTVQQVPDLFIRPALHFTIVPAANGEPETAQGQPVDVTFVETVPPDTLPTLENTARQPYLFQVMAPCSCKTQWENAGQPVNLQVKGFTFQSNDPSRSAAEMEKILQDAGVTAAYNLYNCHDMMAESRNYIFIANVFAYTFIVMISLIAVANVFNTISTNIKLRRRELAMLRSVGMPDRDFNKMMCVECAFYGMRALLFGLPAAVAASWLIYKGMFIGGADNISFVLPWASIGISMCSVLLVIFVTMMYAVDKIKRENIIDALRDDMA